MTSAQIITEIEEGDVLVDLRFASDPDSLRRRIEMHPIIVEALTIIKNNPSFRAKCVERARDLVNRKYPAGYAHPKRTAIAAYVHLLFSVPYVQGKQFIQELVSMDRADLVETNLLARQYAKTIPGLSIQRFAQEELTSDIACLVVQSNSLVGLDLSKRAPSRVEYAKAV